MTIVVRAVRDADREGLAAIYADDSVVRQTAQLPGREAGFWADFYRVRVPDNRIELVAERDGLIAGHVGLVTTGLPRKRHCASFGIAVHADHQRRGVGAALLGELIRQCDQFLGLVRLELSVHADNAGAIALYEKFGFEREGVSRFDIFTDGAFRSSLRMARLNPAYRPLLTD